MNQLSHLHELSSLSGASQGQDHDEMADQILHQEVKLLVIV